jgi:glucokinase
VVQTAVDALARVMAMITFVLNPARFVIGGGVARAGDTLFQPLKEAYREHVLPSAAEGVEIVPAKLGNNAGIIGAAGLIARRENPASAS